MHTGDWEKVARTAMESVTKRDVEIERLQTAIRDRLVGRIGAEVIIDDEAPVWVNRHRIHG